MEQKETPIYRFLPDLNEGSRPILGIVGHGYVGRAVESSFSDFFNRFIVDPNYGTTIDDLIEKQPHITFVCVPTPIDKSGRIDAKILEDTVLKLIRKTNSAIVIKSTATPDVLDRILNTVNDIVDYHRIIYSPEFLREKSSQEDFLNPEFMIFGGTESSVSELLELYNSTTSICIPPSISILNPIEASFVKYAINTFLATKVTFFNQLFDVMEKDAPGLCNPHRVFKAILNDRRMGHSHWRVPGFDGKRGFGGACFPKDLSAYVNYTSNATLLGKVKEINDEYRKGYKLNEREEINNVDYGSSKKEQQDQINPDSV